MNKRHIETLIIGFGKAGKTIAAKLASKGHEVVLVEENEKRYGGTCITVACLPTKFMVHKAKEYKIAKKCGLNLNEDELTAHYRQVVRDKKALIEKLRVANYNKVVQIEDAEVLNGKARFVSDKEVEVETQEGTHLFTADHIIINTGATPNIPDIPGLTVGDRIYDNVSYLEEERYLPRLAIMGAGYIGLEFADFAAAFGTEVTLLQRSDRFVPKEDEDDSEALLAHLDARGIRLLMKTDLKKVEQNGDELTLTLEGPDGESTLTVDGLLVAAGRSANTEGLGLENTSIEQTDRGAVKVDDQLKTTREGVWAVGDVKGGLQFTYI